MNGIEGGSGGSGAGERGRTAAAPPGRPGLAAPTTAIVLVAWNHLETTTRPAIESILRFTDTAYRLLVVDNGSTDETREWLERTAAADPRLVVVRRDDNAGWARGSLVGLDRVSESDDAICLLNSDVITTPGWLARLRGHLRSAPHPTVVIPDEFPAIAEHAGSRGARAGAPAPSLERIVRYASRVQHAFSGRSRSGAPSGFCLLTGVEHLATLRDYLSAFDDFHSKRRSWETWFTERGLSCRIAEDTWVFHARGGSGGYHTYDVTRPL